MNSRLIGFGILNVLDTILSIICISLGLGVEANPVMAILLQNPQLFVFVKLSVGFLLVLWVGRKETKYSNIASWILYIVMSVVCFWNVSIFATIIF